MHRENVNKQNMTMEKSWVMMNDRTDKEHKEQEEVCYDIPERAVYDLETGVN